MNRRLRINGNGVETAYPKEGGASATGQRFPSLRSGEAFATAVVFTRQRHNILSLER